MDKLHLTSIVGARPNFIKLAILSPEIRKVADETIIHTGQHYDYEMDKIFFDDLGISSPNYHLGIGSFTHGTQIGKMLIELDAILSTASTDAIIVYGDANSTLAGALASVKMHIPVIHIEAGCRSYDRTMPEEINRVIVDHISNMLFSPTIWSGENLLKEGISGALVYTCGDVMVDLMERTSKTAIHVKDVLGISDYYLLTIHREENDNLDRLKEIFKGLCGLGEDVVFPCHPRIRKHIPSLNLPENVHVIVPVGYFEMRELEKGATKIITDSGGVQKEAYLLGVPCITLRSTTEWVETLRGGWNVLTGGEPERIREAIKATPGPIDYYPLAFGKPGVCARIAKKIVETLHG